MWSLSVEMFCQIHILALSVQVTVYVQQCVDRGNEISVVLETSAFLLPGSSACQRVSVIRGNAGDGSHQPGLKVTQQPNSAESLRYPCLMVTHLCWILLFCYQLGLMAIISAESFRYPRIAPNDCCALLVYGLLLCAFLSSDMYNE